MSPHTEITNWRKSSRSQSAGNCVETGWTADLIGYRDSKQAGETRSVLLFGRAATGAFVRAMKNGEFDRTLVRSTP